MEQSSELNLEVVSKPQIRFKSPPEADRSGLKAESTHRGWKATPAPDEHNCVVASYIPNIVSGSGFYPRLPFEKDRNPPQADY